jgi:hypothetical protein
MYKKSLEKSDVTHKANKIYKIVLKSLGYKH